jgi:hypothetical protein
VDGGWLRFHPLSYKTPDNLLASGLLFSGACIGAFLQDGKAEVKGKNGLVNRRAFEGLTWKVRQYHYRQNAGSGGLTTSQEKSFRGTLLIFEVLDAQLRISSKLKRNISDMLSLFRMP